MEKYYLDLKRAILAEIELSENVGLVAVSEFRDCVKVFTSELDPVIDLISNISDDIDFRVTTKTNITITKK